MFAILARAWPPNMLFRMLKHTPAETAIKHGIMAP